MYTVWQIYKRLSSGFLINQHYPVKCGALATYIPGLFHRETRRQEKNKKQALDLIPALSCLTLPTIQGGGTPQFRQLRYRQSD